MSCSYRFSSKLKAASSSASSAVAPPPTSSSASAIPEYCALHNKRRYCISIVSTDELEQTIACAFLMRSCATCYPDIDDEPLDDDPTSIMAHALKFEKEAKTLEELARQHADVTKMTCIRFFLFIHICNMSRTMTCTTRSIRRALRKRIADQRNRQKSSKRVPESRPTSANPVVVAAALPMSTIGVPLVVRPEKTNKQTVVLFICTVVVNNIRSSLFVVVVVVCRL
jgi:hypothetical protein